MADVPFPPPRNKDSAWLGEGLHGIEMMAGSEMMASMIELGGASSRQFGVEFHGYSFNPGEILVGDLKTFFPTIRQDRSQQSVNHLSLQAV